MLFVIKIIQLPASREETKKYYYKSAAAELLHTLKMQVARRFRQMFNVINYQRSLKNRKTSRN